MRERDDAVAAVDEAAVDRRPPDRAPAGVVGPAAGEVPRGRPTDRGAAAGAEVPRPPRSGGTRAGSTRRSGSTPSPARSRRSSALEPTRYDDMIPGCYDPKARVVDMDLDGVWGALCFPSFPRFAGTVFLEGEDKELALLCVQAWNDFVLDEWCAAAPDRFIPLVDPAAVGRRAVRRGDPADRGQGRQGDLVPGEPGAARSAVVPHRPLGSGVLRRGGDRHAAVACTSAPPAGRRSPRRRPRWR